MKPRTDEFSYHPFGKSIKIFDNTRFVDKGEAYEKQNPFARCGDLPIYH